jgi:hypothetical protein
MPDAENLSKLSARVCGTQVLCSYRLEISAGHSNELGQAATRFQSVAS